MRWARLYLAFLLSILMIEGAALILYPYEEMSNCSGQGIDDGQNDPEITLTTGEDHYFTPNMHYPDNVVEISCTVECVIPEHLPAGIICVVNLDPRLEDWSVSDPREINFNRDTPPFTATFTVEPFSSSKAGETKELEIRAHWHYLRGVKDSGEAEPVYCTIEVSPIVYLEASTLYTDNDLSLEVGEWADFRLDLANRGNAPADVEMEVIEKPSELEVELSENTVQMRSFTTHLVDGRVRQTSGGPISGKILIRFRCNLPGNRSVFDLAIDVTTYEEGGMSSDPVFLASLGLLTVFFIVLIVFAIMVRRRFKRPGPPDR